MKTEGFGKQASKVLRESRAAAKLPHKMEGTTADQRYTISVRANVHGHLEVFRLMPGPFARDRTTQIRLILDLPESPAALRIEISDISSRHT